MQYVIRNLSYGQDKEGLETRYKELQLRIIKPLGKEQICTDNYNNLTLLIAS
jgi:hypothetical protein